MPHFPGADADDSAVAPEQRRTPAPANAADHLQTPHLHAAGLC